MWRLFLPLHSRKDLLCPQVVNIYYTNIPDVLKILNAECLFFKFAHKHAVAESVHGGRYPNGYSLT